MTVDHRRINTYLILAELEQPSAYQALEVCIRPELRSYPIKIEASTMFRLPLILFDKSLLSSSSGVRHHFSFLDVGRYIFLIFKPSVDRSIDPQNSNGVVSAGFQPLGAASTVAFDVVIVVPVLASLLAFALELGAGGGAGVTVVHRLRCSDDVLRDCVVWAAVDDGSNTALSRNEDC
ncbi:hypothetical protein GJ744_003447 [Endocarpon pusillum]|uniref:Uncharacterized protein n=1 Tax=Endocarpon pusillum TaxID=364733 RepID=A0A8H7A6P9_9EURO|nr:hypothetical protein GJ744_003447 [Endocarpon pusillum]